MKSVWFSQVLTTYPIPDCRLVPPTPPRHWRRPSPCLCCWKFVPVSSLAARLYSPWCSLPRRHRPAGPVYTESSRSSASSRTSPARCYCTTPAAQTHTHTDISTQLRWSSAEVTPHRDTHGAPTRTTHTDTHTHTIGVTYSLSSACSLCASPFGWWDQLTFLQNLYFRISVQDTRSIMCQLTRHGT